MPLKMCINIFASSSGLWSYLRAHLPIFFPRGQPVFTSEGSCELWCFWILFWSFGFSFCFCVSSIVFELFLFYGFIHGFSAQINSFVTYLFFHIPGFCVVAFQTNMLDSFESPSNKSLLSFFFISGSSNATVEDILSSHTKKNKKIKAVSFFLKITMK